ncbi:MAG: response regulator, partial [Candidatus Zixiibacteriota bacterium]
MTKEQIRVLVVDDDPYLLDLLVETLDTIGYQCTPAKDGLEALDLLNNGTYDIVVTDIKMPGMDGISLLRKVRRRFHDLPVLFITGVASP